MKYEIITEVCDTSGKRKTVKDISVGSIFIPAGSVITTLQEAEIAREYWLENGYVPDVTPVTKDVRFTNKRGQSSTRSEHGLKIVLGKNWYPKEKLVA